MWFNVVLVFVLFNVISGTTDIYGIVTRFRDCFTRKDAVICLKERALDALNETILSDEPIDFFNTVKIERNPEYHPMVSDTDLPQNVRERSWRLNDMLHNMVEEFFKSRVVRLSMAPVYEEEARKKGGGGGGKKGGGGMLIMGMAGMAYMVAQLMMGKVAFMAGSALIIAKVALFLSSIIGIKKLASGGGGGGETSHIVYAGGGDYGHSHGGGGGWHRSLEGSAQRIAYKGYEPDQVIDGNGY